MKKQKKGLEETQSIYKLGHKFAIFCLSYLYVWDTLGASPGGLKLFLSTLESSSTTILPSDNTRAMSLQRGGGAKATWQTAEDNDTE